MKVEDLTAGFEFYDTSDQRIISYVYVCQMPGWDPVWDPKNEGNNHIIIDMIIGGIPMRVTHKNLQKLLDKKLFTIEDARKEQIRLTEERLNVLKTI